MLALLGLLGCATQVPLVPAPEPPIPAPLVAIEEDPLPPVVGQNEIDELLRHPEVRKRADWMAGTAARRRSLRVALSRAGRFLPIIHSVLREHGIPAAVAYLPAVETHFTAQAVGRRAVGLWQLRARTARANGLVVDRNLDERRDPEQASIAAARYLRFLYDRFGSWELALAAYNAGPARVRGAQRRTGVQGFFDLAARRALPPITRRYVPSVLAMALIGAAPEEFGVRGVQPQDPLRYETVSIHDRMDLNALAKLAGAPRQLLVDLNPAIRRGHVPARRDGVDVRIPVDSIDRFRAAYGN